MIAPILLFFSTYRKLIGIVALVAALGGFYFHYQGVKSERNELRVENSRLADINKKNAAAMTRLIESHQKTLQEIEDQLAAERAEREQLEDIENDALAQDDGPLAGNLRRLFSRLRNTEDNN